MPHDEITINNAAWESQICKYCGCITEFHNVPPSITVTSNGDKSLITARHTTDKCPLDISYTPRSVLIYFKKNNQQIVSFTGRRCKHNSTHIFLERSPVDPSNIMMNALKRGFDKKYKFYAHIKGKCPIWAAKKPKTYKQ